MLGKFNEGAGVILIKKINIRLKVKKFLTVLKY